MSDRDPATTPGGIDPLDDVAVLELTQMVAGSMVGMHLADLGATVAKVERPGGEIARGMEPRVGGESFYYASVNRGKRSVVLDLATDAGREAFLDLAAEADVVVENYTPGTVEDLGVGYDAVRAVNPAVVYASVSAYGQTGPNRNQAGVDLILQAYAGVSSMTRDSDGRPLRVGLPVADLAGAMYAIQGVLAALRRRDRADEPTGEHLDVALSDCLLSFLGVRAGYTFATGEPFPSIARRHVYFAPEGIFETADGYIQVSTVTQAHWERLCTALDRPELAERPAYRTLADRRDHRDELHDDLEATFREAATGRWIRTLRDHDVPCERINTTETVWEDDHTVARGMRSTVRTPEGEPFHTVAYPVKHEHWDREARVDVASLGRDTESVLRAAGYSDAEIAAVVDRSDGA